VVRDVQSVRDRAAARRLLGDGDTVMLAGTRVRLIPDKMRR
jgi:hypothetical protein